MLQSRVSRLVAAVAVAGLIGLGAASPAKADLRLTLMSGGATTVITGAGNTLFSGPVTIDGYSMVLVTALTNFPGAANGATLSTTGNFTTGAGPVSDLTIKTEVINPNGTLALFTSPGGSNGLNVNGQVGGTPGNATSGTVDFTANVNSSNFTSTNTPLNSLSQAAVSGAIAPAVGGFTQTQTLVLRGVSSNSSSITVNASQTVTAVPEPSSLAAFGLGLPLAGLVARRLRRRSDA